MQVLYRHYGSPHTPHDCTLWCPMIMHYGSPIRPMIMHYGAPYAP